MKKFFAVTLVTSLLSTAASAEYCKFTIEIDATEKAVAEITVSNGVGKVVADGVVRVETKDLTYDNYKTKKEVLSNTVLGQAAGALNIDLSNLQSADVVTLDAEGNRDDGTGATITTAYDKAGNTIVKLGQAGWIYGVCE